jgi:hypothetical protein
MKMLSFERNANGLPDDSFWWFPDRHFLRDEDGSSHA